ncbi:MAG TPA: heme o synthase [Spirochaetia bacterium]|nr:heme o synthase [Spirochaetia bacterium]
MRPQDNLTAASTFSATELLKAYFELTKPRIAALILIVSMASYFIADRGMQDIPRALLTFAVVATLAAGIFALNHYLERDRDLLMRRTGNRPLPSGKVRPRDALIFGLTLTLFSLMLSAAFVNVLTACVGLFTAVAYLLVYTPLKRHTAYHTSLGALAGATPPLMGWAAARGDLGPDAWILFGILFFWQFPHFLSIDMIYREDYERAGILVLPVVDKTGHRVAAEIIGALVLLLAVTLLPLVTGLVGGQAARAVATTGPISVGSWIYGALATVLGLWFLAVGIQAVRLNTKTAARNLLRASVFYLPLIFIAIIAYS